MFPPATPQSERIRIEFESREIERQAAFQAQDGDQSQRLNFRQMMTSLKSRLPGLHHTDTAPAFADPCAQPEPGC